MTDTIDHLKAALADSYTLDRELGAGGMATVYLAHDVKHDRKVAVKVLRPELAAVLGTERFLREIKITASLNHPHILPLLDSGAAVRQYGGTGVGEPADYLYYVMPYVEGESLRDRLDREKQFSVEESVVITKAVASALDYAHRHNVIHRDIKPENILLHDDQPVVADFGISLAVATAGGTRITETGLSLGTPQYMSPEQATGEREITGRSDIYSLACVLYEMLAGDPPHTGSTVQAVIAATVSTDPQPITERRRSVPPHVALALHHALEKIPADRFETAAMFVDALDSIATRAVPSMSVTPPAGNRYLRLLPWLVAAVLAIVVAVQLSLGRSELQPFVVTSIAPPPGHEFVHKVSFALSPDGTQLAFVAMSQEGDRQLWLRSLDTLYARPLVAVDGEGWPFWSPDGRRLGFFANGSVSIIDLASGSRRALCTAAAFRGGAWSPSDTIVFAAESGIWKAAVSGGGCDLLIADTLADFGGRPSFLPDGSHFVYVEWRKGTLELGDLGAGEIRALASWEPSVETPSTAGWVQFSPPDFLVLGTYGSGSSGEPLYRLNIQRIDLSDYSVSGDPIEILSSVRGAGGVHSYSVSNTGTLAYLPEQPDLPPLEFDRDGALVSRPLDRPMGRWTFSVAREHPWLFLGGDEDIWRHDRSAGVTTLVRAGPGGSPVPGPGDSLVAYRQLRAQEGGCKINVVNTNQDFDSELFTGPCLFVTDWSADGRHLLLDNSLDWIRDSIPNMRIWRYSFADGSLQTLVQRNGNARDGVISPDGRWVAFSSDETGASELYVRAFLARDGGMRISRSGGRWPRWRRDGRELYFLSPDGAVYAADLTTVLAGHTPDEPRILFRHPDWQRANFTDAGTGFAATPDGQTFFLRRRTADPNIALIQNWPALMERR